jgi:DNA polymerase-3 subunit alpha
VIGDRPLTELVPLYRDPRSDMPVTQFNMKWVEPAGLVKFDFLGLKTLTVLEKAVKLINRAASSFDLAKLPLDDAKTYEMLARGETVGVFQVESAGMRKALRRHEARPLRGHHRAGGALSPGPDGQHPDLLRAQARRGAHRTTCIRCSSRS